MTGGQPAREPPQLRRELGILDCVLYVAGSIIGTGIYLSVGNIFRKVPHPSLLVLLWVIGGLHALAAGLTYAELGARRPTAGGPYVYLSETFGALWGFLCMWALVFVVMPGAIAILSTGFAEFLGALFPSLGNAAPAFSIDGLSVSQGQLVAIATSFAFTAWNILGIKEGGRLNDVLTVVKIGSLLALVVFGLSSARAVAPSFALPPLTSTLLVSSGGALAGILWAYDGWINVSALGAEVKDPRHDIPGGLVVGVLLVLALYLAVNGVYLGAGPAKTLGASPRAAETAVRLLFGSGAARWLSLAVIVSVLGSLAANIIPGPRFSYAAALDGRLPQPFARIHPRFSTPAFGLMFQGLWAAALTLSGHFDDLVAMVSFAATFFYALGGASIFVYRRREPAGPWNMPGYPWLPALYVGVSVLFTLAIALDAPRDAAKGLVILAAGVLAYLWGERFRGVAGSRRR
ncbi:MAG: APC family permease [Acidithiobacillales bacterium]